MQGRYVRFILLVVTEGDRATADALEQVAW